MQRVTTELSSRYPHLVAAFQDIPQGEAHLLRLQDLNQSWNQASGSSITRSFAEVVVLAEDATMPVVDSFDIIYAGGGLNLLNAAVMTLRYGLRVLVFDRFTVGAVHREWNISRDELRELLDLGLLTPDELENVIQREYRDGLVRFSDKHITVTASELHLQGVLDVAIDAEKLMDLCRRKIQAPRTHGEPNLVLDNTNFVRCLVDPLKRVIVEVNSAGATRHYGARLLIDGMGSTSPIACQLNCGRPFSLVCPTVGTVARGYKEGTAANEIDRACGEVLVTTEDARDGRQLIWETFPGRGDQVAIYLFYYAEAGQRVDLLDLFERFFTLLPTYKESSQVEILKPVYGFIPAGYSFALPWQRAPKVLAYDRVLSLGDAAAFQSPLTFCGFGSYVRNLRRITILLDLALRLNCLQAADLSRIRASEAVPAVARAFSKFMIAKATGQEPTWQVNETLNVFCRVLNDLGPRVTVAFFKDRSSWLDYTRIILKTPRYYARIYALALRTLSPGELLGWISAWLKLARQSCAHQLYRLLHLRAWLAPITARALRRFFPRARLRLAVYRERMEQVDRGRSRT